MLMSLAQESVRTSDGATHQVCCNLQCFLVSPQVSQTPSLAFLDIPFHGKIGRWQLFRDAGVFPQCFLEIIRRKKGRHKEGGERSSAEMTVPCAESIIYN